MKPKIIIPGGTGFIGNHVSKYFYEKGWEVIVLTRKTAYKKNGIAYLNWDGKTLGDWAKTFENAKLILNLAGKSVDCRYNEKNKKAILDSRINSTKVIGQAVQNCKNPPEIWMNAASATIYKHTLDEPANDEINGVIGSGFSVNVCKAWEAEFDNCKTPNTRKIKLRTAITLGKKGGVMKPLRNLVRLALGGHQGDGNQFISWLHIKDFARIVDWLVEHKDVDGIINCASPNPQRNRDFMSVLRKVTGHIIGLPAPARLLEIGAVFIRTETELILKSRKVFPKRLLDEGFEFKFPELERAMTDLVADWS